LSGDTVSFNSENGPSVSMVDDNSALNVVDSNFTEMDSDYVSFLAKANNLSFSFTNVRADNWFNLSYVGQGNIKNSIFYNLYQDAGTTLVDGANISNLYFHGGEIQKVGDILVSELEWNAGTFSGPGTLTLSLVANVTSNAANQLSGGTYLNLGNTTFYTNPNVTTGQPCLDVSSAEYNNGGGNTNATANCRFTGTGMIVLTQGNIYVGKNVSVDPIFSVDPNPNVPYADNLTVIYTTVSNTIFLNGNPTNLNGTLYVYVDRVFSSGDSINLLSGSNIKGDFRKIIFDPQPVDKNGKPYKVQIVKNNGKYSATFNGSEKLVGGLLMMLIYLLF